MLTFLQGESTLPPTITDIPWADAYKIGGGVDAVTGDTFDGSALTSTDTTPAKVGEGQISIKIISTEAEMEREIDVGASGSYNTGAVEISAEASYLNSVSYSATSLTVLAQVEISDTDYATIKDPALKAKAKSLLDSDQAKFKKTHGDYFISGVKSGSLLSVVLRITAESESRLDDFKSKFSGSKGNLFSASGYANFKQAVSSSKTTFEQTVVHFGTKTGAVPPKADDPEELLAWFKDNLQAAQMRAYLTSYSSLDPNFDRTVPVAPAVFGEITALYKQVWLVESRFKTCPGDYADAYAHTFDTLTGEIRAAREELASEPSKIAEYASQLASLKTELDEIYARYALYMSVKGAKSSVPKKDKEHDSGDTNIWHYGYDTWPGIATQISTTEQSYSEKWQIGHRTHTFDWGGSSKYMLVGFTVDSVWHSHNGSWKLTTSDPLLKDTASIYVSSEYDRGTNWKVKWHYVEAKDYQFD
ncbi:MAG: hypothetical protein RKE52_07255 [Marinovum algicola]|jgi:hypothetical protein|uniref:hypothetical protein n=1 Tax=Marinovum algicola TaxID=42444 RepID=UPI0032EE7A6F